MVLFRLLLCFTQGVVAEYVELDMELVVLEMAFYQSQRSYPAFLGLQAFRSKTHIEDGSLLAPAAGQLGFGINNGGRTALFCTVGTGIRRC